MVTNLPDNPDKPHGHRHVLTVIDYFTKWVEIIPMKTKAAPEVAYHLYKLCTRFGCPRRIISDQGN